MSVHLFSFQTQAPNAAQMKDLVLTQPAWVKSVGNAVDPGWGEFIRLNSPQTRMVWRYGANERDYMQGTVDSFVTQLMNDCVPVYSRVQKYGNIVECLNESQIGDEFNSTEAQVREKAKRLSEVHVEYARRMHQLGFLVVAYSHSVGTPICKPYNAFDAWDILEEGLGACDFWGYHGYFQPNYSPDDEQRFLRYRAAYARIQKKNRRPILLSEAGIDGPGGYKNFNNARMDVYIQQLKAAELHIYEDTHWADKYVVGAQLFIYGRDSDRWLSFDPSDVESDRQQLIDYLRSAAPSRKNNQLTEPEGPGDIPPDPPPTGDQMLSQERRSSLVPALTKFAMKRGLGDLSYGEVYPEENGTKYVAAIYSLNGRFTGVITEQGHWADEDFMMFNPVDGAEIITLDPGPQPPPAACTTEIPAVLRAAAISVIEATPEVGVPFFNIRGASLTTGVSAFMIVKVIGKDLLPVVGIDLVNLFPDGRGEVLKTDQDGQVRLQFGASSAYTLPAQGPFTIFLAEGAVKDDVTKLVSWTKRLSHAYKGFGDVNGQHSEWGVQMVQCN